MCVYACCNHVISVGVFSGWILNDDILLHIFSYLSMKERLMTERVSRQWKRVGVRWWKTVRVLSFDGIFVSFKGRHSALTDSILRSILARGCHELCSLDLSASASQLTDYSLHLIGMCCRKLTFLNLSRVAVTPSSLRMLTQHCNGLRTLIIRGCHSVGEKSLWWALHHCQQLETLDVSQNRRLNGQCFFKSAPTLHTVSLRECDSVTDDGIALLAKNCPSLHSINISKCCQLTGRCLHALAKYCSLQELYFNGSNPGVDSADIGVVLSPNLQVLVLDKQMACDDGVLEWIAKLPKLRTFSCAACYGVSDIGVQPLSQCSCLSEVNLSYCHKVSDVGIKALAEPGVLHKLVVRALPNLTDRSIKDLSMFCTVLSELDISGCWQITDKSLYALQENLVHMRGENTSNFSLTVGGTSIDGETALKFAAATGASISLHNLSVTSLQADYHSFLETVQYEEEESWEEDRATSDSWKPLEELGDFCDKTCDWFEADDPALFSDEFSDPEDWGFS